MTCHETWTFQRSLLGCWVHISMRNILAPGTTFYWYRGHKRELRQFYAFQYKSSLVYCNNISGLIKSIVLEHDATEWRFFFTHPAEVSKQFFYIMRIVFHLSHLGIHYIRDNLMSAVNYQGHKWLICGDIKVIGLVIGPQGEYPKYHCFMSLGKQGWRPTLCQTSIAV